MNKNLVKIIVALAAFIVVLVFIGTLLNLNKQSKTMIVPAPVNVEPEQPVVDSATVKSLLSQFRVEKDKFSSDGKVVYKHKNTPEGIGSNAVYCYIITRRDNKPVLRFRIDYSSDDWLFFSKAQFLVDDKPFEYFPSKPEREVGYDSNVMEWSDDFVESTEFNIISALSEAKSAEVKLTGPKFYDVKKISAKNLESIRETKMLFYALGGRVM